MKTTMTAVALVLALGSQAYAQDVKVNPVPAAPAVTAPAATPAAPAAAAKPVLAPEQMQKVGAPAAATTTPAAPAVAPKVEAKPAVTPSTTTAPAATKTAAPAATAAKLVNINTVSVGDLEKLPKIGDVRAKQIVAARPFKSVDELLAKKVIPQDAYDAVKGLVTVK